MVKWLLLAALVSSIAHANEIASDIATEAPPKTERPRDRSIGFRFGMMNTQLDDRDRTLITIGAQWNVRFSKHLLGLVEYDYLIVAGAEEMDLPERQQVHGRGHDLRAGARLVMLDTIVKDTALLYMELEATAGVGYISDNVTGPHVVPNALVGTRWGYELWSKEERSQSNVFGAHLLFGALVTEHDVGFAFQIGMEWGNRMR